MTIAPEDILPKLIKLRWVVVWYPGCWYYWSEHEYPLLDAMVEEGYLDRCITYPNTMHYYRATEMGCEQYAIWVDWLDEIGYGRKP